MKSNSKAQAPSPPPSTSPNPPPVWIGLDWADQKHRLAVLPPGASEPTSHWVEQKPAALDTFFFTLRKERPEARIHVCIEQSRGPVIYALLKYDFVVIYPINPRMLSDFRGAFAVSGAKSDPRDADLLCEFGSKHHQRLRPLEPDDPATRELRLCVELRRSNVDKRTAHINELTAVLKNYYPLALELVGEDLSAPMARAFLRRWPNLARLQAAQPQAVREFFY